MPRGRRRRRTSATPTSSISSPRPAATGRSADFSTAPASNSTTACPAGRYFRGADQTMAYLLEGTKVLDFTRVLAGPFASRILADLGADVVKVEPPEGDMTRFIGRKINGISGYYAQQNVGKRSVCVDLTKPGATALLLRMAAEADVVLENFRPGIMAGFGLGWE